MSRSAPAAAALLLAAGGCLSGGAARGPVAPWSARSPPREERFVFASGATLMVVPMHELPLVSVRLYAEGGARLDPEGRPGLARFTACLLEEGPAGRTRAQFLAELDRLGAEFESRATLDDLGLSLDLLARDLDAGLDLLFAAALEPGFDEAAAARARERTIGELVAAREDEAGLASEAFLARLFPDHRYGLPLAGTEASVRAFAREDALALHRAAFKPANLRVVIAGDVEPARAGLAMAGAAARHGVELGVAIAAEPPRFAPAGREGTPRLRREIVLVHKPGVVQPQVRFGCLGPDPTHPDVTALRAANVPFGAGFTSWLVDRLRVDLGLTYSASSALELHAEGSLFSVRTFTRSATVGQLLGEAFALLDRLRRDGIDAAELERARRAIAQRTVQQTETTAGVADLVVQEQLLRLGTGSVARLAGELGALTPAQVREAVARHLPDSAHVLCVVVGDAAQIGEALRTLGEVEIVDYRTLAPLAGGTAAREGARR